MSREAGDGCMIVKLDLMQRICTSREDQGGEVSCVVNGTEWCCREIVERRPRAKT